MGIADAVCQLMRHPQVPLGATTSRPAGDRPMHALQRQRPGDAAGLARPQRQQQVARLEVGPAHGIDEAQADGRRPADVDAGELLSGDPAGVAAAEPEPAQADLPAPQEQGPEGPSRRARDLHADRLEDGPQGRRPLVDVAADQELQGRAASQLQGRAAGRPAGGRQVFPRRLAAAAGVGQGVRPPRRSSGPRASPVGSDSRARRYSVAARSKARASAAWAAAKA